MLSSNFHTSEFSCHCTYPECQAQRVSKDLIHRLDNVRRDLNLPIIVTSGFRCAAKQKDLQADGAETAKGVSQHELGEAADIRITMVGVDTILGLHATCLKYFNALGLANTFVHVDTRPAHADGTKRFWSYSRV